MKKVYYFALASVVALAAAANAAGVKLSDLSGKFQRQSVSEVTTEYAKVDKAEAELSLKDASRFSSDKVFDAQLGQLSVNKKKADLNTVASAKRKNGRLQLNTFDPAKSIKASDMKVMGKANGMSLNKKLKGETVSKPAAGRKAPAKVSGAELTDWQSIGVGTIVEGFLEVAGAAPGMKWASEIEQSASNPGMYRTKIYGEGNPWFEADDTYAYIHAEEADHVWIEDFVAGRAFIVSQYVDEDEWPVGDEGRYGTMTEEGFTFPAKAFAINDGDGWYLSNQSAKAGIYFPGVEVKDYSLTVYSDLCIDNSIISGLEFYGGADVAYIAFDIWKGSAPTDLDDEYKQAIIEDGVQVGAEYFGKTTQFQIGAAEEGRYSMVCVSVDADDQPHDVFVVPLFVMNHNPEEWTSLGNGTFNDLIMPSLEYSSSDPFEVEVFENNATPGLYRILNPYANSPKFNKQVIEHSHPHYITIDATDPDYVYVLTAPVGVDNGFGSVVLSSTVDDYASAGYPISLLKQYGIPAGKLNNGHIVFDEEALIAGESEYKNMAMFEVEAGELLTLPGAGEVETDYSFDWSNELCIRNGRLLFEITAGADVKEVRGTVLIGTQFVGDLSEEDIAYIAVKGTNLTAAVNDGTYTLNTSSLDPGKYTYVALALDGNGNVVNFDSAFFFALDETDVWSTVGTATFTDLIISGAEESVEVELQENSEEPGYYRLVNPYAKLAAFADKQVTHGHNHYLYVRTDEEGNAYLVENPIGVSMGEEEGEMTVLSTISYMEMFGYSAEEVFAYGLTDGVVEGNTISFEEGALMYSAQNLDFGAPQESDFGGVLITLNKESEPVAPWKSLGTGIYVAGAFDIFTSVEAGQRWEVEIEESNETPGVYRLAPYANGDSPLGTSKTYMIVHAEEPYNVWVEKFDFASSVSLAQFVVETNTWVDELCSFENYGQLRDNVITFPAKSFGVIYNGSGYYSNNDGKFAIYLPGSDMSDYTVGVSSDLCANDGKLDNIVFTAGADVAQVLFTLMPGHFNPADLLGLETDIQAMAFPAPVNEKLYFPIDPEEFYPGKYTILAVSVDANNVAHELAACYFFVIDENDEAWTEIGDADYTELFASELDYASVKAETNKVKIYENAETPGFYRLGAPATAHSVLGQLDLEHTHAHHLYIHAEDPEYVWVEETPYGVCINKEYGEVCVTSRVGIYVNQMYEVEELKEAGVEAGTLTTTGEANVISFPEGALLVSESNYGNGAWYLAGDGVLVSFKIDTKVSDIISDSNNGPVEYFNLQGMRVAEPTPGALYITRQGQKVNKTIVK